MAAASVPPARCGNSWQKRNWTADERASAACCVSDIAGCLIEDAVVECFQADADILRFHGVSQFLFLSISKSEKQQHRPTLSKPEQLL